MIRNLTGAVACFHMVGDGVASGVESVVRTPGKINRDTRRVSTRPRVSQIGRRRNCPQGCPGRNPRLHRRRRIGRMAGQKAHHKRQCRRQPDAAPGPHAQPVQNHRFRGQACAAMIGHRQHRILKGVARRVRARRDRMRCAEQIGQFKLPIRLCRGINRRRPAQDRPCQPSKGPGQYRQHDQRHRILLPHCLRGAEHQRRSGTAQQANAASLGRPQKHEPPMQPAHKPPKMGQRPRHEQPAWTLPVPHRCLHRLCNNCRSEPTSAVTAPAGSSGPGETPAPGRVPWRRMRKGQLPRHPSPP